MPRYRWIRFGRKSHFLTDRKYPNKHDITVATWMASAVASHCSRPDCPYIKLMFPIHESSRYARVGINFDRRYATHASLKVWYKYGHSQNSKRKPHHT